LFPSTAASVDATHVRSQDSKGGALEAQSKFSEWPAEGARRQAPHNGWQQTEVCVRGPFETYSDQNVPHDSASHIGRMYGRVTVWDTIYTWLPISRTLQL